MAKFFIDRPVFAWVIALVIMLAGIISLRLLPVAQYPDIAPPSVSVSAVYPGASAKAVEDSVTQIIEQQMTGLDGLEYFSSSSSSSGASNVTLTFAGGTDPDIAQVQVQNKLARATPLLPEQVQRQGITVAKANAGFLIIVGLVANDESYGYTEADLADYASSTLIDPVSRIDGVGNIQRFGAEYAMRVWLDTDKLTQFNLAPSDVVQAIREQNTQVSSGAIGAAPFVEGQQITATITLQSLLQTPQQFRDITLLTTDDGASVRLEDVARVEVGAAEYSRIAKWNGKVATGFAVQLATGANALETAEAVRERVAELTENTLPPGVEIIYPVDSTPFIDKSIHEVEKTLYEAVFLVFLVMLVFLQSFRATLVPMIAVPVVLLGTFAIMLAFGFSINTLTMFAMVLAIGLLVDDAIVVVENVERVMAEEGLSPREATRKSMDQITGALVGIAVVLSAVFVPMAFFPGSTGIIYRQFSITIVSAMILSVVVAIVLSPALCANLLKHKDATHEPGQKKGWRGVAARPADWFNRSFAGLTDWYAATVARILRRRWLFVGVFVLLLAGAGLLATRIPTSFLPEEDQGSAIALVQLPPSASMERTEEVMEEIRTYILEDQGDAVMGLFTASGFSFAGQSQNMGLAFIRLKDWEDRDISAQELAAQSMGRFSQITEGMVFTIVPPPISELGNSSGFDLYLQDVGGVGHDALLDARNQLLGMAGQNPTLMGVRPNGQEDNPQYNISVDFEKAQSLGLNIAQVNSTLSVAIGGLYVNDYIDRGRIKRVYVQADAPHRMMPEDIADLRVRNNDGEMIPLSAFTTAEWTYGSPQLQRYNGVPALNIQGQAAPGYSSGEAMDEIENIIAQLPQGIGYEWTGLSLQEQTSGNQAPLLYALSILVVFLCLAALYESWTVPISVLLIMPLGIIGALVAASFRGLSNDIFFQVGLLTTIGLASKNAILIVEFAKLLEEEGKELIEATLEAVRMRFRPILMTSLAFGFGVIPLALSTGAGAAGRVAIGSAVLGGMIAATVLGVFFAPLFYVIIRKLTGAKPLKKPGAEDEPAAALQPAE
ncbi:efflux RND transporter permease subunit [Aquisalinus flavus]|uniref:Efflux pump membrane transporter n=1 Tax=Aquisalinus flavus TaxID=1526572 RepID=A0A8J2Y648_9PROT|nr:efflux RND transporter permease subunit [Aquisalinus flavus]MBD0427082.1 efflux RND transporter permease subunit [Aquisalinus flavus]UNE46905.1 efflux RND transporter permease subunit [Aquisalinus flavus]GGC98229.1 multidrug efflux RND transporter permease subunit [Aquisalinus flavus]